jgi:hypothetical protein
MMQGVHCSVELQHRKGYECLVAGVIIHANFLKHALFSGSVLTFWKEFL